MNIAAIMPCRGRAGQTVTNVKRLLATAGYDDWHLICVVSRDEQPLADALVALTGPGSPLIVVTPFAGRVTYWQALAEITTVRTALDITHYVNLANDLLPGMHWLRRAVEAYQEIFGPNAGLLGFNGDSHEVGHSCHFMIDRRLLSALGGWPVWYDHNFGDTELCQRTIAIKSYAKAPWALLYHDHPYWGGADDAVYAEGRATSDRDAALYEQRRRAGWSSVAPITQPMARSPIAHAVS